MRMILSALASACLLASAGPSIAQDVVRTIPITFARGASSAAVVGSVRGYDSVDYTIRARAAQTLTVRMTTNNASSYFNLTAPGADAAMFNGSIDGNRVSTALPTTGTYTVRVYLIRAAARRGEVARFTLNVVVL